MKIYLIRHGDPDYEHDTLTDQGHREAEALVAYLRAEGISRGYSSPLGRARDTAQYAAEALNLAVTEEQWMAELDLAADTSEFRASWDIPGHLIRNNDYLRNTSALEQIPLLPSSRVREVLETLRSNSDRFLDSLGYRRNNGVYQVKESSDQKIAVFAHGGFGLSWLSILLEIPAPLIWSGFFLHTSSVTQILFDERSEGIATPRCLMVGAVPHLFASSIEPGRAGISGQLHVSDAARASGLCLHLPAHWTRGQLLEQEHHQGGAVSPWPGNTTQKKVSKSS